MPTDLSGQSPLSYMSVVRGGSRNIATAHITGQRCGNSSEPGSENPAAAGPTLVGWSFSGPPFPAGTVGISLVLTAAVPPQSLPRSSGSPSRLC